MSDPDASTDSSVYQDDDQDAEPTMTAPAEGRPDGVADGKDGTVGGSGGSTPDAEGAS